MKQRYRKQRAGAPTGFFACEAMGLRWLRVPAGPPVVEVLEVGPDYLDLVQLTETTPSRAAAVDFGRQLAILHEAGAPAFGSPPQDWSGDGFFGPLDQPLPMRSGAYQSWGVFMAECRIAPLAALLPDEADLLRLADVLRSGALDDDDHPARLHGDLWSGNVLWTADGATLIDPAAHGGHRESDLATLALFGLPYLAEVIDGYQQVHPLRRGWQHRIGLHQIYPVGMHAVLFGGGYHGQLRRLVAEILAQT